MGVNGISLWGSFGLMFVWDPIRAICGRVAQPSCLHLGCFG